MGKFTICSWGKSGQGILTGRISTINLLVLTSSNYLLLIVKMHIFLFLQTSYLNKEVNCTEPSSPLVSCPWSGIQLIVNGQGWLGGNFRQRKKLIWVPWLKVSLHVKLFSAFLLTVPIRLRFCFQNHFQGRRRRQNTPPNRTRKRVEFDGRKIPQIVCFVCNRQKPFEYLHRQTIGARPICQLATSSTCCFIDFIHLHLVIFPLCQLSIS